MHEPALVPPDAKDEDHTSGHGLAHLPHGAEVHEALRAAHRAAVLVVQVVDRGRPGDVDAGVLDDLAVLDVQAADRDQLAVAVGGELRDGGERAARVDHQAGAEVLLVADDGRVVAAAVLVADSVEGALVARASVQAFVLAWMWRDVRCHRVGLEDVHLVAACALAFDVGLVSVQQIL